MSHRVVGGNALRIQPAPAVVCHAEETPRYRAFEYYQCIFTDLLDQPDGSYRERAMKPNNGEDIFGALLTDGTFLWSTDAPSHSALLETVGRTDEAYAVRLQASWDNDHTTGKPFRCVELRAQRDSKAQATALAQLIAAHADSTSVPFSFLTYENIRDGASYQYEAAGDTLAKYISTIAHTL